MRSTMAFALGALVALPVWRQVAATSTVRTNQDPSALACSEDPGATNQVMESNVLGTYLGTHKDWRLGFVTLRKDGTFIDERGNPRGKWEIQDHQLAMSWDGYPAERLFPHDGGKIWSSREKKFVLVKE